MKRVIILFCILAVSLTGYAKNVAVLSDLMKPERMVIDDNQIYVTEGTSIFIYNLKDFKLKKKFGKAGEGPQEFKVIPGQVPLMPYVENDNLVINCWQKLLVFTKDGNFIRETKTKEGINLGFWPVGDGFVGMGITMDPKDQTRYRVISIFDDELNKVKEIYRVKDSFQMQAGGGIKVLDRSFDYYGYRNMIFAPGETGFTINVFDKEGKKLRTVEQKDYKQRKFTEKDREIIQNFIKTDPIQKQYYEMIKDKLIFPDYYPEIMTFLPTDNNIYVLTWEWKDEKLKFVVFDMEGNLKVTRYVPFTVVRGILPSPFWVRNGKLYQLIENEDDEQWEMFAYPIVSDVDMKELTSPKTILE